MKVTYIEKPSFTVIGKLGQGYAKESSIWLPPLWKAANDNFGEISHLAKMDDAGNLAGIWGAMSGMQEDFAGWTEEGKYLAGCEVNDNAAPPSGWTKWVIPAYRFAVTECNQNTYQAVFAEAKQYILQQGLNIAGAVHEFYNPKDVNGEIYLYYPIQRM